MKSPIVACLLASALLAGCADNKVPVAEAHHRKHVSPMQVEPPSWPADSFDETRAKTAFDQASAAQAKGDLASARQADEQSLSLWPVSREAWDLLSALCTAQGDADCQRYAGFYRAKLDMIDGLPMHAATLGFQTVSEAPIGSRIDSQVYDQRMHDMAVRLWVFCSQHDAVRNRNAEPVEESLDQTYPYIPAIAIIGAVAGILSGIKALAN